MRDKQEETCLLPQCSLIFVVLHNVSYTPIRLTQWDVLLHVQKPLYPPAPVISISGSAPLHPIMKVCKHSHTPYTPTHSTNSLESSTILTNKRCPSLLMNSWAKVLSLETLASSFSESQRTPASELWMPLNRSSAHRPCKKKERHTEIFHPLLFLFL